MGYPTARNDFIATGFNDRANHRMLLRELEETLPLAARHGVPNVIAMFGNRRGKSDAEAIDNCVDRKSTRLNSSHQIISYAVFCLKKKKTSQCPVQTAHA